MINCKKQLCSLFDCHATQILFYLNKSNEFNNNYNVNHISLNDYVASGRCYFNNTELENKHKLLIEKADVLILQVIEKDRNFLNNDKIINLCKKDCLIIKIPHYRSSIYEYRTLENCYNKRDLIQKWNLPKKVNVENVEETIKYIKEEIVKMNNFPYDSGEMKKSIEEKCDEFKKIDNSSSIKMLDFFENNYKLHRLFESRSYPSSFFFHELANRILIKLDFCANENFIDSHFAHNTFEPVSEFWYNFCNFKFKNICHVFRNIEVEDYEWYYLMLISNGANVVDINQNLNYINKIRNKN